MRTVSFAFANAESEDFLLDSFGLISAELFLKQRVWCWWPPYFRQFLSNTFHGVLA